MILILNIIIFILCIFLIHTVRNIRFSNHFYRLMTAKRIHRKIQRFSDPAIFAYLRKIDPFVFEELLLLSFKNKGYSIKRNKRYTGDGGIDGKVIKFGKMYYIQAKRYKDDINWQHVKNFISLCEKDNVSGFFVHTGKTPLSVRDLIKSNCPVKIISGIKLIQLLRK